MLCKQERRASKGAIAVFSNGVGSQFRQSSLPHRHVKAGCYISTAPLVEGMTRRRGCS